MFSDDSDSCWTTYSQDERIEAYIKEKRKEENREIKERENNRRIDYEELFESKQHIIFHLKGLSFQKFMHRKIKFWFEPSKVQQFVSKKILFYCSLIYEVRYSCWKVRRDTFPVDIKQEIYALMYESGTCLIGDEKLLSVIWKVYGRLVAWSEKHSEFRQERWKKYQNGELAYFELDTDDEEIFMTDEQRAELHEKRVTILRKMLPHKGSKRRQRQSKHGNEND